MRWYACFWTKSSEKYMFVYNTITKTYKFYFTADYWVFLYLDYINIFLLATFFIKGLQCKWGSMNRQCCTFPLTRKWTLAVLSNNGCTQPKYISFENSVPWMQTQFLYVQGKLATWMIEAELQLFSFCCLPSKIEGPFKWKINL